MKYQCSTWDVMRQLVLCYIFTWSSIVFSMPEVAEVLQLTAEPDFHSVKLHWESSKPGNSVYGFQIHYCELQAWGPNRCRTKIVDSSSGINTASGKKYHSYSITISSLRMSTNYSFEVRPLESKHNSDTKEFSKTIVLPTRGFSAKANLCLPDVSEVEVLTGPYFGGRIAVESSSDGGKPEKCSVGGDANSSRDSYILRIEHKACGSNVNRTTVSTFILVQENLPILTHSTRRFLVLCTFQPETLTVRAGINLPHGADNGPHHEFPLNSNNGELNLMNEVGANDIQVASLQANEANHSSRQLHDKSESHLLLTIVLSLSCVIGIGVSIWWYVPMKQIFVSSSRSSISSYSSNASVISSYENYTNNSIPDYSITTDIDFRECIDDNFKIIHENNGMFGNEICNKPVINKIQSTNTEQNQGVPILTLETSAQSEV